MATRTHFAFVWLVIYVLCLWCDRPAPVLMANMVATTTSVLKNSDAFHMSIGTMAIGLVITINIYTIQSHDH